jgi:cytochrome c oxidase cbb3-type subunit 3
MAAAAMYWHGERQRQARLLMADPDELGAHSELVVYALARGRRGFAQHCAACHGPQAQGDPRRGVPDLTDRDWLYGSGRSSEIERVILYGIRAGNSKGWNLASMPAFATPNPYRQYALVPLRPSEIDDLSAYLLSLQSQPGGYAQPGSEAQAGDAEAVARGQKLYRSAERGLCWDCHGERARGNSAIGAPDLVDSIWLYGDGSRSSIYRSIAYGRAGVCPAWVSRLDALSIRSIALYVHSLSATDSHD